MTTTALSQHTGVTVQFIEQILKTLKRGGLTRSSRGAAGGHMLARAPEDISLGGIVRLMEGGIQLTVCCSRDSDACARRAFCLTRSAWVRASQALERALEETTLATLMEGDQNLEIHDEVFCRSAGNGAAQSVMPNASAAPGTAELY